MQELLGLLSILFFLQGATGFATSSLSNRLQPMSNEFSHLSSRTQVVGPAKQYKRTVLQSTTDGDEEGENRLPSLIIFDLDGYVAISCVCVCVCFFAALGWKMHGFRLS